MTIMGNDIGRDAAGPREWRGMTAHHDFKLRRAADMVRLETGLLSLGEAYDLATGIRPAKTQPTTICPECEKTLSPGEVIENFCDDCGLMTPKEVLR